MQTYTDSVKIEEKKQTELNRPANLLHYLKSDIRTQNKNKDSKIELKQKQTKYTEYYLKTHPEIVANQMRAYNKL